MPTAKQIAASRANSQKSTGPRTAAGKAASCYNALKHGIHAQSQIVFDESAEDLAHLAAELHEQFSPADAVERFLVDTMVNNEWRLRRLRTVEAGLWQTGVDIYIERHPEQGRATESDGLATIGPTFERLQRIVNSCERNYHRARKELAAAQAARADDLSPSQPEESKTTSEFPASLCTNPEIAIPTRPFAAPNTVTEAPGSGQTAAQSV